MSEPYYPGNWPSQVNSDSSGSPSLTQQSFAQEADINYIIGKYNLGQFLANPDMLSYRDSVLASAWDVSGAVTSYQDCLNKIIGARNVFAELPADIRARFNNDPQEMIAWLQDAGNAEEAVALGIVSTAPIAS